VEESLKEETSQGGGEVLTKKGGGRAKAGNNSPPEGKGRAPFAFMKKTGKPSRRRKTERYGKFLKEDIFPERKSPGEKGHSVVIFRGGNEGQKGRLIGSC